MNSKNTLYTYLKEPIVPEEELDVAEYKLRMFRLMEEWCSSKGVLVELESLWSASYKIRTLSNLIRNVISQLPDSDLMHDIKESLIDINFLGAFLTSTLKDAIEDTDDSEETDE